MGSVGAGVSVEVDAPSLLAEADAIAGAAPEISPAPGGGEAPPTEVMSPAPDPLTQAAELTPVVTLALTKAAGYLAPNWKITREEAAGVGESLSMVLAYWMPDAKIDPKWAACIMLASSVLQVVDARRDPLTGELPPLHAPPPDRAPAPSGPAPSLDL